MKPSKTLSEDLSDMTGIETTGDLRRVVGSFMLALTRKEVSATDLLAMSKAADSINNSMLAEVKVAKLAHDLRSAGSNIAKATHMGQMTLSGKPVAGSQAHLQQAIESGE